MCLTPALLPPPACSYVRILKADNLEGVASTTSPTWQVRLGALLTLF